MTGTRASHKVSSAPGLFQFKIFHTFPLADTCGSVPWFFSNTAVLLLVAISYPLQTAIMNYPLSFISVLSYALHEAQALYVRAPCAQGAGCFCHLMFVGFGVPLPPTPQKNPHGCVKLFSSSSHIQQWSIN